MGMFRSTKGFGLVLYWFVRLGVNEFSRIGHFVHHQIRDPSKVLSCISKSSMDASTYRTVCTWYIWVHWNRYPQSLIVDLFTTSSIWKMSLVIGSSDVRATLFSLIYFGLEFGSTHNRVLSYRLGGFGIWIDLYIVFDYHQEGC